MLRMERAYDPPSEDDGTRVLVEGLWPRGLAKEWAAIDIWCKEVSPSPELRKWYAHDVSKWNEFRERYLYEIRDAPAVERLRKLLESDGDPGLCRPGRGAEQCQGADGFPPPDRRPSCFIGSTS